jgi:hypothetical protein
MKSLILLLFVAMYSQAQSLPELARRERQRQAGQAPTVVFTADKAKGNETPAAPAGPPVPAAAESIDKPADPAVAAPAAAKPVDDRMKKYADELARLKARIVELQDRETATQLQINDAKNQFLAPVTDTTSRQQAQTRLSQAQAQLGAVQKELADTRLALQVLESLGPPKP